MTTQESFKKRVRERMARTGERYTTARQALLAKADGGGRTWVSPPEMSDDAIRAATGHGWDHWCDLIDGWRTGHGGTWDHATTATRIAAECGLDGWWSQAVTVSYERISGLRLPNQMADGTFTANKSRTVAADADKLRELLLDDGHRADLFPGVDTVLRSKPTSKGIRLGIDPGVVLISLTPKSEGRTTVALQHTKLPDAEEVERWRFWWAEWLEAIDQQ